jgi:hypothetical protein
METSDSIKQYACSNLKIAVRLLLNAYYISITLTYIYSNYKPSRMLL